MTPAVNLPDGKPFTWAVLLDCGCIVGVVEGAFVLRPHTLECDVHRWVQARCAELGKEFVIKWSA